MVIEVEQAQYQKLRGHLIFKKGQTVSDWVREKIGEELGEKAAYRTHYLK